MTIQITRDTRFFTPEKSSVFWDPNYLSITAPKFDMDFTEVRWADILDFLQGIPQEDYPQFDFACVCIIGHPRWRNLPDLVTYFRPQSFVQNGRKINAYVTIDPELDGYVLEGHVP